MTSAVPDEVPLGYPEGIGGWIAKVDVNPAGGIALGPNFFIPFEGERPHLRFRIAARRNSPHLVDNSSGGCSDFSPRWNFQYPQLENGVMADYAGAPGAVGDRVYLMPIRPHQPEERPQERPAC